MLDQMELRPEIITPKKMISKSDRKLFSFSEIANTVALFECAFDRYEIQNVIEYKELSFFYIKSLSIYRKIIL